MPRERPCDTDHVADVLQLFETSTARVVFADGSERWAAELAAEGRRVASWLTRHGMQPGDRIAIRLPNGPGYVRLLLGCAAGGFVAVCVNVRYSAAEAAELIERTGAQTAQLDNEAHGWPAEPPIEPIGGRDDPFVVFTTSGTTNRPKLVLHRQHSIADHAHDAAAGFGYRPDDTVLVAMPLGGTFGLASLTAAVAGAGRVVVADFDVDATARLIASERVTCVNGSDDMFHRLLDHGADLTSVRLAGYARFNTSLDGIVERAEAAGAVLTGLYGMSEVQALFAVRDPAGGARQRSRPGGTLVSARAAYRVVDGELQLRGPSLFAGYLADGGERIDEALTARHFDHDWFRTGDLAEPNGPATFEYTARMGDVMRLGGFLVTPDEVEQVLMTFDGVDAAQVVAVDRPGGARPVAFVIAPGGVDEDAVIVHCRERLARYKVPVKVLTIDAFPTTPSANGTKIQKVELRSWAIDALEDRPS